MTYVMTEDERAVYVGLDSEDRRAALAKCRRLAEQVPYLRDYYEAHAAWLELIGA